jgi:hypothetical protein
MAAKIATRDTIIGCSNDDIQTLEEYAAVRLPESYKAFLRIAGRCAGALCLSDDWLYPELLELTDWGRKLVKGYCRILGIIGGEVAMDGGLPEGMAGF